MSHGRCDHCCKKEKHRYKYCCDDKPTKKCCPAIDDAVCYNRDVYQCKFKEEWARLPIPPGKKIAIITCMDARVDIWRALGVCIGDVHTIRNAGGVVTDDVIRSLTISQRLLATEEIMVVHHFDCGMRTFDTCEFNKQMEDELCQRPEFAMEAFEESAANVKENVMRILRNPFVKHKKCVRGFVYMDVDGCVEGTEYKAGELAEVCLDKIFEKACTKADFCKDDCDEEEHCDKEYQCCRYECDDDRDSDCKSD